jgi:hypothetical protein
VLTQRPPDSSIQADTLVSFLSGFYDLFRVLCSFGIAFVISKKGRENISTQAKKNTEIEILLFVSVLAVIL